MLAKLYSKLFHIEMMRSSERRISFRDKISMKSIKTRESFNVTVRLKNNVNVRFMFFPKTNIYFL